MNRVLAVQTAGPCKWKLGYPAESARLNNAPEAGVSAYMDDVLAVQEGQSSSHVHGHSLAPALQKIPIDCICSLKLLCLVPVHPLLARFLCNLVPVLP